MWIWGLIRDICVFADIVELQGYNRIWWLRYIDRLKRFDEGIEGYVWIKEACGDNKKLRISSWEIKGAFSFLHGLLTDNLIYEMIYEKFGFWLSLKIWLFYKN